MRVHHLNCGTMSPVGLAMRWVCHCLLVESSSGLVLVDTGIGIEDQKRPRERLGLGFSLLLRPACDESEAAARQVARMGYSIDDVRHIVITHLDLDHAGGLP